MKSESTQNTTRPITGPSRASCSAAAVGTVAGELVLVTPTVTVLVPRVVCVTVVVPEAA